MSKLNVGIIGSGGFMRSMHIPNMQKNTKYKIHAVMDIDSKNAKETADMSKAEYWTDDIDRILSDKDIDVVFIGTRHDTHAEISVKAANAGKHIFCEKPMALDKEGCKMVAKAVKKNNVKYTIGYNRGMAPMVTKARDMLEGINEKVMVYHRIQSYFPELSYTHDPKVGGGRIIGEGCHIFDLISEIIQKEPVMVYASGGTFLNEKIVKIPDSAIVTITYEDGSIGSTVIASAGNSNFTKEATEIYCDKKAIYINNFMKMECYGFEGRKKTVLEYDSIDKGHAIQIDMMADAIIKGTKSPNGPVKAARAALISYYVIESIKTGRPVQISKEDYIF